MRKNIGISTIGLMIGVIVVVLVAYYLLPGIISPEKRNTTAADHDLTTIMSGLENYKKDNGFYPSDDQTLSALVQEPSIAPIPHNWAQYLKEMPTDPWGNPYQYENVNGQIRVWSFGPEGPAGSGSNNIYAVPAPAQ